MEKKDFSCVINVEVKADKALEQIKNIAGWWATNVLGDAKQMGDIFTVRFGKTFAKMKVIEDLPQKKTMWLVIDSEVPLFKNISQWNGTKLLWEVQEEKEGATITFTHVGLTPDTECYSDCTTGWTFYVKDSLFKLITQGKGLPGTGIFGHIVAELKKFEGLIFYKSDPVPDFPEDRILVDVKETNGERVISAYNVSKYSKQNFDPQTLKGEYYMLIEDVSPNDAIDSIKEIQKSLSGDKF